MYVAVVIITCFILFSLSIVVIFITECSLHELLISK